MANSPEILSQAIARYKAGDRAGAAVLFAQVVRSEPENEAAWLWLGASIDDLDKKRFCLQQALNLNPDNQDVRRALEKLNASPEPPGPTLVEMVTGEAAAVEPAAAAQPEPAPPTDTITLVCPACGGNVEIAAGLDSVECVHCGRTLRVQRDGMEISLQPVVEQPKVAEPTPAQIALDKVARRANADLAQVEKERKGALQKIYLGVFVAILGLILFVADFFVHINLIVNLGVIFIALAVGLAVFGGVQLLNLSRKRQEILDRYNAAANK